MIHKSFKFLLLFIFINSSMSITSEISQDQLLMLESLPPDQRNAIIGKMGQSSLTEEILDTFTEANSVEPKAEFKDLKEFSDYCPQCIFGFNFFQFAPNTFAPVDNSPVNPAYIMGPGDKVEINFYGSQERKITAYISREGKVVLPLLGPVNFLGKTYEEAKSYLSQKVASDLLGVDVDITLVEARSIGVYVLGEAYQPGRYVMSGLSSVSNALFVSGGVNEQGSLRNIQIKRKNDVISTYDFYDFLLKGSLESDVILQDGDIIFIPFIENSITIGGAFKRPHRYEFIKGETIEDAIFLAGGFNNEVHGSPRIELSSINNVTANRELSYLSTKTASDKTLKNGDVINISSVSGIAPRIITLTGEVNNPGDYSIQPGDRILDIINRAGGYTSEGYFPGAVFLRKEVAKSQEAAFDRAADALEDTVIDIVTQTTLAPDQNISQFTLLPISELITKIRNEKPLGRMVVNLDMYNLKTDPMMNFLVQDGDKLHIPRRPSSVSIVGEVLNSASVGFNPGFDVNDYIQSAGGLKDSADSSKIFVILPDGKSELVKMNLFASSKTIIPGSTIVISRDSRPFDAISLTQIISPILADLATSAAALSAISR